MTNWALITGSTSGIGAAFATLLAKENYQLVLVGRNEDKLTKQANELKRLYGVAARSITCDLSEPQAADVVYQQTKKMNIQINTVINNAGFNEYGSFLTTDRVKELKMIQLHTIFPTEMMKLFLPDMMQNEDGKILNVGSTGSIIPCPYDAVYAATKAYLLSVSKAIGSELKDSGVTITTLCPGSTETAFAKKAGMEETLLFKLFVMKPEIVASIGYQAMIKGKTTVVSGLYNKMLVLSSCLLPDRLINYLIMKML